MNDKERFEVILRDADFIRSFADYYMQVLLLKEYKCITEDETENLYQMLDAKDIESRKLAHTVIDELINKKERDDNGRNKQEE